jgi:hypothetical protein
VHAAHYGEAVRNGLSGMVFRDESRSVEQAILLLILGVLVCLAFLHSPGTGDRDDFLGYMQIAREKGILSAYPNAGPVDYPPLSFFLLGVLARIADAIHISDFAALKVSLAFLTLACSAVAGVLEKSWRPELAVGMFLTVLVSGVLNTYIDLYFVIFLLLTIYCFSRGYVAAGTALFAIASLVKWQPIILTPLILLYAVPWRPSAKNFAAVLPAAVISLVVCLFYAGPMIHAFTLGWENLRLSGQGLNLNWLITGLIELQHPLRGGLVSTLSRVGNLYVSKFPDDPPIAVTKLPELMLQISSGLRYFCYFVTLCYFFISDRSLVDLIRALIICFMCYFVFGYAVHESHACVPAVLGICWFAIDRNRFVEATALAVIWNMDMLVFYGFNGSGLGFSTVVGWDVTMYLSAFNVIFFFILWLPVANIVRLRILRGISPKLIA